MTISKTEIARRQLGTALALFIQDADPVSGEHAAFLARVAKKETFNSHALATFPGLSLKELRKLRSKYCNVIKHPETQTGEELHTETLMKGFSDVTNEHQLFVAWYDYMLGVGELPVEAQVFQLWYFALHPHALAEHRKGLATCVGKFENIRTITRPEQKQRLRDVVARSRDDSELMLDQKTDGRPLILGALE